MPDISMCGGIGCPVKKNCYRFTATPCLKRQAYADFRPDTEGQCKHFWTNKEMYRDE